MDPAKLYSPEVLRDKVPTLHPRYQWMKLELEPDDRIVLTSISGRYTVGQILDLTGLPEDSVARVILKLVGRGVVLWDDTLPFYDEATLLDVMPTFDPQNTNRNAHLDDTDRMLLTLINGRTTVRQMEAALPLSRDRLLASVIRLRLADVIGIADVAAAAAEARAQPGAGAATYQVPEGSGGPPPKIAAAPQPAASPPSQPAPTPSRPAATTPPSGSPLSQRDPGTGRAYKTRQDAFEEATRRLLSGESLTPEFGGDDDTPVPAPRKTTSAVRDREPPRYEHKTSKPSTKEAKKPRTAEVRSRPAGAAREQPGAGLTVGKALLGLLVAVAVVGGGLALTQKTKNIAPRGSYTAADLSDVVDLAAVLPPQSGRFYGQVKATWFDLSPSAKSSTIKTLGARLAQDYPRGLVLVDEDGKELAKRDEDGTILIFE